MAAPSVIRYRVVAVRYREANKKRVLNPLRNSGVNRLEWTIGFEQPDVLSNPLPISAVRPNKSRESVWSLLSECSSPR
jgi:hypothetical protein